VPDVIIPPDTLSAPEQHVLALIRRQGAASQQTLYGLAREIAPTVTPQFTPRPEWSSTYVSRLRAAGVALSPALVDSTRSLLSELVAQRVAEIAFGDSTAFRRLSTRDTQFQKALALIRSAPSISGLLSAALRAEG
jgi:hypothetical protein